MDVVENEFDDEEFENIPGFLKKNNCGWIFLVNPDYVRNCYLKIPKTALITWYVVELRTFMGFDYTAFYFS